VAAPGGHVAIVASAFDATLTRLDAAGHPPEPRTPHWGAPRAYVHSPSGHLVELMAAPPPASG
jgi:catechol 2,3-dioxygenase-like lactoylglutathione lyase family enzyme